MTYTPEPYQPMQPTPGPVPAPVKPKRRWPWVTLAAVVGVIVGAVLGAAGGGDPSNVAASPRPTVTVPGPVKTEYQDVPGPTKTVQVKVPGPRVTVTVRPKAPAKPKRTTTYHDTIPGNGTFLVGRDIAPGEYRSKPASGGIGMCSWERMSGLNDSSLDDFIDGDVAQGPTVVSIEAGDKAFKTNGCQTWHRI